jgi:hypothetical protein
MKYEVPVLIGINELSACFTPRKAEVMLHFPSSSQVPEQVRASQDVASSAPTKPSFKPFVSTTETRPDYWRKKIRPALELCFKIHREYLVLHGGLSVIHASKSSIVLPDGLGSRVAQIPLRVWGRAAALSDGRMADGRVDVDLYAESSQKKITLEPFEGSRWRLRRMRSVYGNSIDFRLQQIDA